jgi:hypothetical protein
MADHTTTTCAVLHTDGEGNVVPCPGYPHAEDQQVETDPLADARLLLAEHERQQDEACRTEIEQVLAKYGRKLVVTQPQITIVPT